MYPPNEGIASSKRTDAPCCVNRKAALSPPAPLPTTIASTSDITAPFQFDHSNPAPDQQAISDRTQLIVSRVPVQ
jgi:hypothetical protein